jgi:hypothetical protein
VLSFDGFWAAKVLMDFGLSFDEFWAQVLMGFVTGVEYFSSFERSEQHTPYIHTARHTDIHTYVF